MASYTVSIGQLARRCDKLGEDLRDAAVKGLRSAGRRMIGVVVEEMGKPGEGNRYPPQNTGELMRSVRVDDIEDGALVTVDAPHASVMEYGARPFSPRIPPLQAIADWLLQKGLVNNEEETMKVAWPVAKTIARWGLNPRHFMARAVDTMGRRRIIADEIKRELAKIKPR